MALWVLEASLKKKNIHSDQAFTVCFKKQDRPKTQKKLKC